MKHTHSAMPQMKEKNTTKKSINLANIYFGFVYCFEKEWTQFITLNFIL